MTTLRLLLRAPYAPGDDLPWALCDEAGALLASGRDPAGSWPDAAQTEIVVGADQVRIASVALPPMTPARVAGAVSYALEDQLAHAGGEDVLVPSAQRTDGKVEVAILARPLLASIRSNSSDFGTLTRAVAEPALAQVQAGWCWCAPDDRSEGDGFARRSDGSAFALSAPANGALPPELALALDQAARSDAAPPQVRVDAHATDADLERWTRETDVAFERGNPWRWHAAPPADCARASTLLQGEFAAAPPPRQGERTRLFIPALAIAAAALALHVVATLGEWAWWRVDAWRASRALAAVAVSAGVDPAEAANGASAMSALAGIHARARHAHALAAPADALPLLAKAAPALAALPPGALKSATYADGHWTLDLLRVDAQAARDLEVRLRQAGTPAIVATTAAGARLRLSSD